MAHQLNGAQLAALLQHWHNPVVKSLLGVAATSGAALVWHHQGRPMPSFGKLVADYAATHTTSSNTSPGVSVPSVASPNILPSEIFGTPAIELFSAAGVTVQTNVPELPILLDNLTTTATDAPQYLVNAPITTTPTFTFSEEPSTASGPGFLTAIGALLGVTVLYYGGRWVVKKMENSTNTVATPELGFEGAYWQLREKTDGPMAERAQLKKETWDAHMKVACMVADKAESHALIHRLKKEKTEQKEQMESRHGEELNGAKWDLQKETALRTAHEETIGELQQQLNVANQQNVADKAESHALVHRLEKEKAEQKVQMEYQHGAELQKETALRTAYEKTIGELQQQKTEEKKQMEIRNSEHNRVKWDLQEEITLRTGHEKTIGELEQQLNVTNQQIAFRIIVEQQLQRDMQTLNVALVNLQRNNEEVHTQNTELVDAQSRSLNHLTSFGGKLKSATEKHAQLSNEIHEMTDRLQVAQSETESFRQRNTELQQANSAMEESKLEAERRVQKLISDNTDTKNKLNLAIAKLEKDSKISQKSLEKEVDDLKKQLHKSEDQVQSLSAQVEAGNEKLAKQSAVDNGTHATDAAEVEPPAEATCVVEDAPKGDVDNSTDPSSTDSTPGKSDGPQSRLDPNENTATKTADTADTPRGTSQASPLPATSNRQLRKFLIDHFTTRNSFRKPYSDDQVIELQLPCFDPLFEGLSIPKPVPKPQKLVQDGKKNHDQCNHCHEWYAMNDLHNHFPVCKAFFMYAVYCKDSKKVFMNNKAFREMHDQGCSLQDCRNPAPPVARQPTPQTPPPPTGPRALTPRGNPPAQGRGFLPTGQPPMTLRGNPPAYRRRDFRQ